MKKLKWLFAILLLLNIFVFIYLARVADRRAEAVSLAPKQEFNALWLSLENTTSSQPIVILSASEPQEPQSASTPVLPAPAPEASTPQDNTPEQEAQWCLETVRLTEQDYTALKTRLAKITHTVKKTETKEKTEVKTEAERIYWVHLPEQNDPVAKAAELKAQGFNASQTTGKQVTLGLFKDANAAQSLKQKAFNAGFTQTTISEQVKPAQTKTEEKIVASYQISFARMDEKQAKQAQAQLKRKVKVAAKPCQN